MDTEYIPYPEDPRIGVSRDGRLFNLTTGKVLKQHLLKSGYYNVVITSPGVKAKAYRVHRVLMMSLNPVKNMGELFVNHKDGVKTNNSLLNLEWITPKGNVDHAIVSNLWSTQLNIEVLDRRTNETTISKGLLETARRYGLNQTTLHKHIHGTTAGAYNYDNHSFRLPSSEAWPPVMTRRRKDIAVKCVNIMDNTLHVFDSMAEAAQICGLPYRQMYHQLVTKCKPNYNYDHWKVIV